MMNLIMNFLENACTLITDSGQRLCNTPTDINKRRGVGGGVGLVT